MPRLLAAILTIASLLLSACTTLHKGTEFSELATPRKDAALVYLYRSGVTPFWRSPTLVIDGKDISEVKNSSFTYFYLSEGKHTIATRWALDLYPLNVEGSMDVKRGQTYFLKLGGGMMMSPGFGHAALITSVSSNLSQVNHLTAIREMKSCMYISNSLEQPSLTARKE